MGHVSLKKWLLVPVLPAGIWMFLGGIVLFGVAPEIYTESGSGEVVEKISKDAKNHAPSVRLKNGRIISAISVHNQILLGDHVEKTRGSFIYVINGRSTNAMSAYMGEFAPMVALASMLATFMGIFMVLYEPKSVPRLAGTIPAEVTRRPPPPSAPPTAELALPYREGSYDSSGTFTLALPQALAKLGAATFARLEDKILKMIQSMVTLGGSELHLHLSPDNLLISLHSPTQSFSPVAFEAGFEGHVLAGGDSAEHYLAVGICSLSHGPVQAICLSHGDESVVLMGSHHDPSSPSGQVRLAASWRCPDWEPMIDHLIARCVFAPLPLFINGELANGRVGWQQHDRQSNLTHATPVGTRQVPHWHYLEAFFGGTMPSGGGICLRPSGACRASLGPTPPWPVVGDPQRGYPWTTEYRVFFAAESGSRPLVFRGKYHLERFDSQVGHTILCLDEQGSTPGVVVPVKAGVTLEPVSNIGCGGLYAVVSAEGLSTDLSGFRVVSDQALLNLALDLQAKAIQALQALIDSPQVLPARQFQFRAWRALAWLVLSFGLAAWAAQGFAPVLLVAPPLLALLAETGSAFLEARQRAPQYQQQEADLLRARVARLSSGKDQNGQVVVGVGSSCKGLHRL